MLCFNRMFALGRIILPLGISFFTFEQIGYLTDIRRGHRYRADLLSYSVFVSFFPRLVAGPILRYSEIRSQLTESGHSRTRLADLVVGLDDFLYRFGKETILADGVAPFVAPVFNAALSGGHPDSSSAGAERWPIRVKSISTFPAIRTWLSAPPGVSEFASR